MPNVYTDINDFLPYARSMAKRVIREGKHDGVQQFTNDLVALSNAIYDLAQEMPAAWEQYRKITNERERQSREIAEKQRYIEELNKNLVEQFGSEGSSDDSDADILSMLSDSDDMFDFGDDDASQSDASTQDADRGAEPPQQRQEPADGIGTDTQDDGDNDDELFAVFGGDYGNDGDGRDAAESDSWGNADERAYPADDDIEYGDATDDDDGQSMPQGIENGDDIQPDIDWSAAEQDDDDQQQPQPSPQTQPAQPQPKPSSDVPQQQDSGNDPFDDDDIDVLLDDDALLGL